jgi:hypothetical protein
MITPGGGMEPRRPGGGSHAPDHGDTSLGWWFLSAAGAGLLVGAALGSRFAGLDNPNWTGLVPPTLGVSVTTGGVIVGLFVLGLLLAIPDSTRPIGVWMMVASVFVMIGFAVGGAIGPRQAAAATAELVQTALIAPVVRLASSPFA